MLKYGHQAWSSMAGDMYAPTVEIGRRPPSGPPRRWCDICGKLRVGWFAERSDSTVRCTPCSVKEGRPIWRNAYAQDMPIPQRRESLNSARDERAIIAPR